MKKKGQNYLNTIFWKGKKGRKEKKKKKGWWYDIFPYLVSFRERKQKEQEGKIQYLTLPFKIAYSK